MVRFPLYAAVASVLALSSAPAALASKNIITTESAWLVGPAKYAQAGMAPTCVMSNQYGNGFYVNFSGGAQGLEAMKVDFRQPSFKTGRDYDVGVVIPPSFTTNIKGRAYNKAGLEFDLSGDQALAEQIESSNLMYLKVGRTVVPLSTSGIQDGMNRMNACAGGSTGQSFSNIQPASGEPVPLQISEEKPQPRPCLEIADTTQAVAIQKDTIERAKIQAASQPVPQIPTQPVQYVEPILPSPEPVMEAKKELVIPMREQLALPVPAARQANAEVKDNQIIISMPNRTAKPASDLGNHMSAQELEQYEKSKMQPVPVQIVESVKVATAGQVGARDNWQAMQGLSLRDTLLGWSRKEGVDLIWDADNDFAVLDTLTLEGGYEAAVSEVLEQYAGSSDRPYGSLHVDPQTGDRILLVQDQNRI